MQCAGDAIRLVEREPQVEHRISDEEIPAACVSVAKPMPRCRQTDWVRQSSANPAEGGSKAIGSEFRPDIPQGKRLGFMRVLDRPAVSSKPGKDGRAIA